MKQVTEWYRLHKGCYHYNHLEYGWNEANHPKALFESQNVWLGQKWLKRLSYLDNENVVRANNEL